MSYMLLIIQRHEEFEGLTVEEGRRRYDRMMAFGRDLSERGVLVAGESLGTDRSGVRLRKRDGRQVMVDGPFAETKEIVGGFFLLDCATADQAKAIAETCPAAEWSTVEIRKIGKCWEDLV